MPAEAVWAFHAHSGAFQRLMPGWQTLEVRSWRGTLRDARLEFVIRQGPARLTWIAQHDASGFVEGEQFVDVMERGPASAWRHTHRVTPTAGIGSATGTSNAGACELDDHIVYRLPLYPLGQWLGGWKFEADLRRMFLFRHARTAHDAARHARFAGQRRLHIVLTGSNGTIGAALLAYLVNAGHRVDRLVRAQPRATGDGTGLLPGREVRWDPVASGPDAALIAAIDGCDAVIHLGAAGIAARRWTDTYKRELVESRVRSTALLAQAIARCKRAPEVFMVASGTNIYRPAALGDVIPREEDAPVGDGFLARLALDWEGAAAPAHPRTRVVNLRLGVVLSAKGGFLKAVAGVLPAGASRFGDGRAVVPWVHVDDVLGAVEHVLHTPGLRGAVNIAAPSVESNAAMLGAINVTRRSVVNVPVSAGLLRLMAGEMSEAVLASQPVSVAKLVGSGFVFAVPTVAAAAAIELGDARGLAAHRERMLSWRA